MGYKVYSQNEKQKVIDEVRASNYDFAGVARAHDLDRRTVVKWVNDDMPIEELTTLLKEKAIMILDKITPEKLDKVTAVAAMTAFGITIDKWFKVAQIQAEQEAREQNVAYLYPLKTEAGDEVER